MSDDDTGENGDLGARSDLTPARARPKSGLEVLGLGRSFWAGVDVEPWVDGAGDGLDGEPEVKEELESSVESPPILDRREATGASSFFSPGC